MHPTAKRSADLMISAHGERLAFVSASDHAVTVRTTLRLCPGRQVTCRLGGAAAVAAEILSSTVCRLSEQGAEYLVSLALSAEHQMAARNGTRVAC
jgi:hypothetical protein